MLESQGKQDRTFLTHGGRDVHLKRDYARCLLGRGLSPWMRRWHFCLGPLSPRLQEDLVHLITWMPFARAATELAYFKRVEVSDTSVRHHTEVAGAAYVAVQTTARERLERERPAGPDGPDVLQVSADGAMVPLVGGERAEVKTVAVGRVEVVTN